MILQDPSKHLIYLDSSRQWTPTVIPVNPLDSSPISTAVIGGKLCVFYISAKDNCMHYARPKSDGGWSDEVFSKRAFGGKVKQFIITPNLQSKALDVEAYILTEENAMLQITGDGQLSKLGRVDGVGKFVSERSVDLCCVDAWENTLTTERLILELSY